MDLNWKALLAAAVGGLGAFCVVTGVAAIYEPAGLIVAGLFLLVVAFVPDWGA